MDGLLSDRKFYIISIMGLFLLIFLRDVRGVGIPIFFYTVYVIGCALFYDQDEIIGLGMSMVLFNHALQINYILFVFSILLFVKNRSFKRIKSISFALIGLLLLEFFHVCLTNNGGIAFETYIRWTCVPIFIIAVFSSKLCNSKKTVYIFVFSSLFSMIDILFQTMRYENNTLLSVVSGKYRFGNVYLYNNEIHYSIYDNENNIAFYCILAILALSVINYEKEKKQKTINIIMMFCFVFFGALTRSRSFIICLVLIGILLLIEKNKMIILKKQLKTAFGVLISLGVVFMIFNNLLILVWNNIILRFSDTAANAGGQREELFFDYIIYWVSDIRIFFLGSGTQNLTEKSGIFNSPHSFLTDILASFGLIGLIILGIIWYWIIKKGHKNTLNIKQKISIVIYMFFLSALQYVRVPALFATTVVIYMVINIDCGRITNSGEKNVIKVD